MRFALALIVLAGCADSPKTAAPPHPAPVEVMRPVADSPAPVAPKIEKRIVVSHTRPSGSLVTTTAGDGAIVDLVYHVLQNGRGPHVEAHLRLGLDGTPVELTATGHHEMGTKVAEMFTRSGDRATWKSEEESGTQTIKRPTFFVPIADMPFRGWLVAAALKAGGTIALLPAGEATVKKVAELEVDGRKLVGYAITGLDLVPVYSWFDAGGGWFGDVSSYHSVVPEGWDKAIAPIVARQDELSRAWATDLAKATAHRPPAAGLAYTHARVLDVENGKWIADQTVVVVGDTIKAVGPKPAIPKGAEIVDLAGKALLPGLVDMHSHTEPSDAVLDIASGVTTVRDVGNDPDQLDDMKARFDAGTSVGPHIVRMGFIEGRNDKAAAAKITAETVDEANQAVEFYAKRGYDGIKIYNSMKVELVPVLAAAAHKHKMLVTGHIPVHMLANEAVTAGYDGIEHINMLFLNFFATHETDTRDTTRFTLVGDQAADFDLDAKPVRDFIQQLKAKRTVIDPTLAAFEDLFAGVPGKITPGLEDTVSRFPLMVQRGFLIGGLPLPGDKHDRFLKSWDKIFALVKLLWQSKVTVVAGTDHIGGLMLHHELALFARAGIPNAAVLKLATIDAARAMRLEAKFGSITVGKQADLIVIDGDPIADIKAIRKTVSTMRGGVVFAPEPLYRAVGVQP